MENSQGIKVQSSVYPKVTVPFNEWAQNLSPSYDIQQKQSIIKEIEKIESWKGDAYQSGDDVEISLNKIKGFLKDDVSWVDQPLNTTNIYDGYEEDDLKRKHESIRTILIENGNVEYGDCIIDEICDVVGIPPTTVYYVEGK